MTYVLLRGAMLAACVLGSAAHADEYIGICEASAGAFLDADHFAVASDETNRLQIYRRGTPEPIGEGFDGEGFTSFDKSDLEAAARSGDRVYWISSHSFNNDGEDKAKRKVLFATAIGMVDGRPSLTPVGQPLKSLRDALALAAGVAAAEMNIEAMAATAEGGLLIGLRAPLRESAAIVLELGNPAEILDDPAAKPELADVGPIDLGGLGLRGMEALGDGAEGYIIVAGPVSDAGGFSLFRWAGPGTEPEKVEGADLSAIRPESAMAVPGAGIVQLLSDDGDVCSDEDDPPEARKFRSADVMP